MDFGKFNSYHRKYGINLTYDEIDTRHADMCFSNITRTHSV